MGIFGAVTDYAVRYVLLDFGAWPVAARAASYAVGSIVAYYLNSFVTFNGRRSVEEKARAASVYAACFAVAVSVDFIVRNLFPSVNHVLFWAWFVSQGCATVVNFSMQKYWVFAHSRS